MDIRKLFTNVPFDENMQPIVGAENEEYAEKILAIAEEMNEIESKLANTDSIENK